MDEVTSPDRADEGAGPPTKGPDRAAPTKRVLTAPTKGTRGLVHYVTNGFTQSHEGRADRNLAGRIADVSVVEVGHPAAG